MLVAANHLRLHAHAQRAALPTHHAPPMNRGLLFGCSSLLCCTSSHEQSSDPLRSQCMLPRDLLPRSSPSMLPRVLHTSTPSHTLPHPLHTLPHPPTHFAHTSTPSHTQLCSSATPSTAAALQHAEFSRSHSQADHIRIHQHFLGSGQSAGHVTTWPCVLACARLVLCW